MIQSKSLPRRLRSVLNFVQNGCVLLLLMEAQNPQHGHPVEISVDFLDGERSGGSKGCGEAPCGFSDTGNNSKNAKERSASMRKLWISVVLCIVFMSAEVAGGIKANSLAILTDAAHLLSDVAGFAISLFSLWAAGWEATPRQSYGFFRIEILGALVSMQLIWLLAGILVYETIIRLIHDTGEVDGFLMFLVAAFGLLVNIIMALVLGHDHGHDHDHKHGTGHSHGITVSTHNHHHVEHPKHDDNHHDHSNNEHHHYHEDHVEPLLDKGEAMHEKKQRNINVQGAYLHVLGDSVQSIGVMIGGAVIWYKPEWKIIDLICTLIFSVIVLGTTIKMLRNILEVLMESTPREIDASKIEKGLSEMENVVAIHELHIWAITVGKILLACHVKIRPEANADMVLDNVINYLRREYNISHVTIQIER
ncbi:PREDICTED: metal tolerance protein 1-like isoform X1 [Populus euphratica]|uniref:Metal tolerance protein 1-like isoform X1 n=2 Tax=Populus euphratica TaxID=75702 RepID=A0AAJ6V1I1_POPEU|nr:PREDICTED: metal tolerance protein 1-like isoform X1 [Populus euphratica]